MTDFSKTPDEIPSPYELRAEDLLTRRQASLVGGPGLELMGLGFDSIRGRHVLKVIDLPPKLEIVRSRRA